MVTNVTVADYLKMAAAYEVWSALVHRFGSAWANYLEERTHKGYSLDSWQPTTEALVDNEPAVIVVLVYGACAEDEARDVFNVGLSTIFDEAGWVAYFTKQRDEEERRYTEMLADARQQFFAKHGMYPEEMRLASNGSIDWTVKVK